MNIKAQKIDEFASTVDFRLMNIFTLAEHGSSVHQKAVLAGNKIGGFEKDTGPVLPVHCCPLLARSECCINCLRDMTFISQVKIAQHMFVLVGRADLCKVAGTHLL